MPAPKGNHNGRGMKGRSGRKSAYQEKADAETLHRMYFEHNSQEEIEQRIRQGKFSIKDRHILNAMEGNQKAISPIFQKVFPDKIDLGVNDDLKAFLIEHNQLLDEKD